MTKICAPALAGTSAASSSAAEVTTTVAAAAAGGLRMALAAARTMAVAKRRIALGIMFPAPFAASGTASAKRGPPAEILIALRSRISERASVRGTCGSGDVLEGVTEEQGDLPDGLQCLG